MFMEADYKFNSGNNVVRYASFFIINILCNSTKGFIIILFNRVPIV